MACQEVSGLQYTLNERMFFIQFHVQQAERYNTGLENVSSRGRSHAVWEASTSVCLCACIRSSATAKLIQEQVQNAQAKSKSESKRLARVEAEGSVVQLSAAGCDRRGNVGCDGGGEGGAENIERREIKLRINSRGGYGELLQHVYA